VIEDSQDVGVVEAGDRRRLLLEALFEARVMHEVWRQNLYRYKALERRLASLVDDGHTAPAHHLHDLVGAQRLAFQLVGTGRASGRFHHVSGSRRRTKPSSGRRASNFYAKQQAASSRRRSAPNPEWQRP